MKKSSLVFSVVSTAVFFANADVAVDRVVVHQLWPWSQNVKCEYELSGTEPGKTYDLQVGASNGSTVIDTSGIGAALVAGEGLFGITGDGTHSFTFDPTLLADGNVAGWMNFKMSVDVKGEGDPLANREEYRIFDLDTGAITTLTRKDIYNRPDLYGEVITNYAAVGEGFTTPLTDVFIATGFTNDIYKTQKLVMKRIHAKDVVWNMGPADGDPTATSTDWNYDVRRLGESRFQAKFSSDYYVGIYELTQDQYFRIMGTKPSYYCNVNWWATRPVESVSQEAFLSGDGFAAQATTKCGKTITIPTEAQWEFAARAGSDAATLPNGQEATMANVEALENFVHRGHTGDPVNRDFANEHGIDGGGTYAVGRGKPNAYGLYDTLANVSEWTTDLVQKDLASYYASSPSPVVDPAPTGQNIGSEMHRVYKGSNFLHISRDAWQCRPVARFAESKDTVWTSPEQNVRHLGFRVISTVDD